MVGTDTWVRWWWRCGDEEGIPRHGSGGGVDGETHGWNLEMEEEAAVVRVPLEVWPPHP